MDELTKRLEHIGFTLFAAGVDYATSDDFAPRTEEKYLTYQKGATHSAIEGILQALADGTTLMTREEWAGQFIEFMEYVDYDTKDSRGTGAYTYKTVCGAAKKMAENQPSNGGGKLANRHKKSSNTVNLILLPDFSFCLTRCECTSQA